MGVPEVLVEDGAVLSTESFYGFEAATPPEGVFGGWDKVWPFIDNSIAPAVSFGISTMHSTIDDDIKQDLKWQDTYINMVIKSDDALFDKLNTMQNSALVYWLLYYNKTNNITYQYEALNDGSLQLEFTNELGKSSKEPAKGDGCKGYGRNRHCKQQHYWTGLCKRSYDGKVHYDYGQCVYSYNFPGMSYFRWDRFGMVNGTWGNIAIPQAVNMSVLWKPASGKDQDFQDCNCADKKKDYPTLGSNMYPNP